MEMCKCVHIYSIHIYIQTYIHIYKNVYVNVYIYTEIHTDMYMYLRIDLCAYRLIDLKNLTDLYRRLIDLIDLLPYTVLDL